MCNKSDYSLLISIACRIVDSGCTLVNYHMLYSSPFKFSPILIGFNSSRDAIVFVHTVRPQKIPGWIILVRENVSVNKRVCRK